MSSLKIPFSSQGSPLDLFLPVIKLSEKGPFFTTRIGKYDLLKEELDEEDLIFWSDIIKKYLYYGELIWKINDSSPEQSYIKCKRYNDDFNIMGYINLQSFPEDLFMNFVHELRSKKSIYLKINEDNYEFYTF